MPDVELVFYQEYAGATTFLDEFKKQPQKLQESILAKLKRVREEGYRVKMPTVERLEDGLCELRVKSERNNYRILFFFHNHRAILLPDIHRKDQRKLPRRIVEKALKQKAKFEADPYLHSA
jgi:phage-related protein